MKENNVVRLSDKSVLSAVDALSAAGAMPMRVLDPSTEVRAWNCLCGSKHFVVCEDVTIVCVKCRSVYDLEALFAEG